MISSPMAPVFPSRVASNMLRVLTAFWLLATAFVLLLLSTVFKGL